MSIAQSWHQRQRPVILYHDTKYTVVSGFPGAGEGCMRFDTLEQAQRNLDGLKQHHPGITAYILPPHEEVRP